MRTPLALRSRLAWLALVAVPWLAGASTPPSAPAALPTPAAAAAAAAAVEDLLAADRAFAAASARVDVVAGLSPMLSEEIVMPAPPGRLVRGKAAVLDALRENPDNAAGRVEWAPVRGGLSADGLH